MNFFNLSLLKEGGLIMWPLSALALIGLILFIERLLYLHKGQIRTNDFVTGIKNLLRKRRLIEALTVCEETPGPVANVIKAALLHYDSNESDMRLAIQSSALVEIPNLERRIGSIAAIAKVAPLLGLLGTILGMLQSFYAFQKQGTYLTIADLSGGFQQALLSTAVGLTLGIIAYLAHHFLYGRVRALVHDMEWVGNDVMQFLLREMPEEEPDAPPSDLSVKTKSI